MSLGPRHRGRTGGAAAVTFHACRSCSRRSTTATSRGGEARRVRRLGDAAGVPHRRAQGARRGARARSASSTSATSARSTCAATGAVDYLNTCLSNDLGKIGPGQAQYTLACDAATGGIVDDLIAYYRDDDHVLLVPNAANSAEVMRRLEAEAARRGRRSPTTTGPTRCSRCRAPRSDEVLDGGRAARRARLHVLRGGLVRRARRRGLPHRLHGGAGLRADRRERRRRRRSWDALLAGGRAARDPALRAGRARHPAHRDGLPAARPGHQPGRHPQPGPGGLGGRLVQARVLGQGPAGRREGGRPAGDAAGLVAQGRGIARPEMSVKITQDLPIGHVTSGTFSPDAAQGHRAGPDQQPDPARRRGPGRRPRPARGVRRDQAALRRDRRTRVLTSRRSHPRGVLVTNTPEPAFGSSVRKPDQVPWWWQRSTPTAG